MAKYTSFAVRLPEGAINEMEELAGAQYMPTRTMVRAWIMQRLETERMNEKPATGTAFGDNIPAAAAQRTQNGVVADA